MSHIAATDLLDAYSKLQQDSLQTWSDHIWFFLFEADFNDRFINA